MKAIKVLKWSLVGLVVLPISVSGNESAKARPEGTHIVGRGTIAARLAAAEDARAADLATLDALLYSASAARVTDATGMNPQVVRTRLTALNDDELRDLADRARALDQDPTATMSFQRKLELIMYALGAIAIILLLLSGGSGENIV